MLEACYNRNCYHIGEPTGSPACLQVDSILRFLICPATLFGHVLSARCAVLWHSVNLRCRVHFFMPLAIPIHQPHVRILLCFAPGQWRIQRPA